MPKRYYRTFESLLDGVKDEAQRRGYDMADIEWTLEEATRQFWNNNKPPFEQIDISDLLDRLDAQQ